MVIRNEVHGTRHLSQNRYYSTEQVYSNGAQQRLEYSRPDVH